MLHAAVIMEPGTSQSRGFGFVHFPDAATASMAAQAMNRKQVRRRLLAIGVGSIQHNLASVKALSWLQRGPVLLRT